MAGVAWDRVATAVAHQGAVNAGVGTMAPGQTKLVQPLLRGTLRLEREKSSSVNYGCSLCPSHVLECKTSQSEKPSLKKKLAVEAVKIFYGKRLGCLYLV